jgi:hypothetical protein
MGQLELLASELAALADAGGDAPALPAAENGLVEALLGPLRTDPPRQSAAAEAAMAILLIALAEGRPLNVVSTGAGDIDDNNRLEGDRGLSQRLSTWLGRKNIPVTLGALASSSYRAGYRAGQAQTPALTDFVNWISKPRRNLGQIKRFALVLLAGFLAHQVELPALPRLRRDRLTAVKFREIVESLLAEGSQGAFEQYLVTAVLRAEMAATGQATRAETKSVRASDRSTGAGGDVEIRQGMALVDALEVTGAVWTTKLSQIAAGARRLDAVTVVGRGVQAADAETIQREIERDPRLSSVDVRLVELMGLIDFCSSRIDGNGRADALSYVYSRLALWHRSEPVLIERLVEAIEGAGVAEEEGEAEITVTDVEADQEVEAVLQRLTARIQQGHFVGDEGVIADLKRLGELASSSGGEDGQKDGGSEEREPANNG